MKDFTERVLNLFHAIHPLDRIPRAGFVLRGVPDPESVAAHSHSMALLALIYVECIPNTLDRSKVLGMALVHDLAEARLMDIAMPYADAYLAESKHRAEEAIFEDLFQGFPAHFSAWFKEFHEAETQEAKLLRALDKAQMMLKVLNYRREHRGDLEEFWVNPKNFRDFGFPEISDLFDAICNACGKPRPV